LELVVRDLEDGRIGLDESLARYEEGVRLLKVCRESLQTAERKIMLLTGIDANGNPLVESFAEETSSLEEKKDQRARRRSRTSNMSARNDSCEGEENRDPIIESDRQKGLF
jgi:exodeoxyribonuclease VII small subunit